MYVVNLIFLFELVYILRVKSPSFSKRGLQTGPKALEITFRSKILEFQEFFNLHRAATWFTRYSLWSVMHPIHLLLLVAYSFYRSLAVLECYASLELELIKLPGRVKVTDHPTGSRRNVQTLDFLYLYLEPPAGR